MKKKNRWLLPLIIAIVVAAVLAYVGSNIYNLMYGGSVTVSTGDVISNIKACTAQLVLIAIAIVAVIAIAIAVRKMNEAKRSFIRWESVLAATLVIAIAINWICLGTEYSLLSQVLADEMKLSEETQAASLELAQTIASEGIVLLKNEDNALPLDTSTKLNVFGWGSTQPVYGGSGSGDVNESTAVSLLQGLKDAGYILNDDLTQFYVDYRSDRPEVGMGSEEWTVPQPTIEEYDEAGIFEQAVEFSDTAVIVITRSGGEGMDLPEVYSEERSKTVTQQGNDIVFSTQEDDLDSSKSYLELTYREIDMVERVTSEFEHVIVIINSSNVMEMGWVDEYDIDAVLWVAGTGVNGFEALGQILSGEVNPSGKTVDTWVYDLMNTYISNNYGDFIYTNSDEITNGTGEVAFLNYVESIYVGYKFYETAAVEGLIDYDSTVQYPFGYGLSYTTFEQEITSFTVSGTTVTMEVTVTNTGSVAGKDVVEVYYNPPYTNGGIEKSSANLLDFAKTSQLDPGASEVVTITFELEDMASYDDTGIKAVGGAYVLEAGDYIVSINSDAHNVIDSRTITVDDDVIYNDENDGARSTDLVAATNLFDDARGDVIYLSRADGFANYDEATASPTSYEMSEEQIANYTSKATTDLSEYDDPDAEMPTTGADNGLTLADMTGLDYDDPLWEDLLDQLTVDEMVNMVTDGGFKNVAMSSIDAPQMFDADGPASLSSNFNDNEGTAFPCATMIAATWNQELAYARGTQMGIEGNELGITGWYGPAMNIHRSAFSGRNFEYYSEDGTLSGIMGGLEVKGATEQGMLVYMKHFVLNDQETNRTNDPCTWTTEQALREIYLKAFESAFKDGNSTAVMTSFNSIGTVWAGGNESLLMGVLRGEWGFHGSVVTDAMDPLADFYMDLNLGIRTGLTKGLSFSADSSLLSNTDDANTVIALRYAAHENLYAVANSNGLELNDNSTPNWVLTFYYADAALAVVLLGAAVVTYLSYRKERKESSVVVVEEETA